MAATIIAVNATPRPFGLFLLNHFKNWTYQYKINDLFLLPKRQIQVRYYGNYNLIEWFRDRDFKDKSF